MPYTIIKDFESLCISHQLVGLPEGHKCGRVHGHNVVVRVVLASPDLDDHGFVVDYGELAPLKEWLWSTFDHRHLNDVLPQLQPSAENMAKLVYDYAVSEFGWPVASVGWSETPATWALYTSASGVGKIEETDEERAARIQATLDEAVSKVGR